MPDFQRYDLVAFVATSQPAVAKRFYGGSLGLRLVSEDPFAIVFDAHGTMLRVTTVRTVHPPEYTVLGWQVPDIAAAVDELARAGIETVRYPGMHQDERGVWTSPGGARVAWFNDPDRHILSLTQF